MNFKASVTEIPKKGEDNLFKLKIETYKEKIEGTFEKSELRHLIQIIDNSI